MLSEIEAANYVKLSKNGSQFVFYTKRCSMLKKLKLQLQNDQ